MAVYTHSEDANSPTIWWGDETRSGASLNITSNLVVVPESDGTETRYIGSGISFSGGVWSGIITGAFHTNAGGGTVYEIISGFSIAAGSYLSATNVSSALSQIYTGNDTMTGYSGRDTFVGYGGDDTLSGGNGSNAYNGGGGNDTFIGGTRGASVDFDLAYYNVSAVTAGITVSLSGPLNSTSSTVTGNSTVGTDTLTNIDSVRGSNYADTFTATNTFSGKFGSSFNEFEGMDGDDTITGNGNTRVSYRIASAAVTVDLAAGTGQSTVAGNTAQVGVDHFTGVNAVVGSAYADNISAAGVRGNFSFTGLGGNDTFTGTSEGINDFDFNLIRYDFGTTAGITVSLGATSTVTGDASVGTDTLVSIEAVRGTNFADTFTVASNFSAQYQKFNYLEGMGGNDTFTGNGSTRVVYAQALAAVTINLQTGVAQSTASGDAAGIGVDTFVSGVNAAQGSRFDDTIIGSDGSQAERFIGLGGNDTIDGGGGLRNGVSYGTLTNMGIGVNVNLVTHKALDGFGTVDTLIRIQDVGGSDFRDVIVGDSNSNFLIGENGSDDIRGGGGDDVLSGDDTNLSLFSGVFGVSVEYDSGNDRLAGGAGTDLLVGGPGDDHFVFNPGDGTDTVQDFTPGAGSVDKIVLAGFANIHSLSDVLAVTTDISGGTVMNFGNGDTLTLTGVSKASLTADDFILDYFGQLSVGLPGSLNPSNGWTSQNSFPRQLADVSGDGSADIIGFGNGGVYVALANGNGTFASPIITLNAFNPGNGWTNQEQFPRLFGDVNGDGKSDIVAFGNGGVYVSLATGGGNFTAPTITLNAYNPANGWTSQDQFTRQLADVDGDGKSDIVAFGNGGVYVSLATGNGNFAAPAITLNAFNPGNGWTSQDQFPRLLGDVNGDGKSDIVAFGNGGVYVALATGGGNFAAPAITLNAFNPGNGWTSQNQFLRQLADVDGDGMADVVGFGNGGVYVAHATGDGNFANIVIDVAAFNPANGWTSDEQFHRALADVNNDGSADIIGFGNPGVLVALANDYHML